MENLKRSGRYRASAIISKQRQVINKLLKDKQKVQETCSQLEKDYARVKKEHDLYVKMYNLEKELVANDIAKLKKEAQQLKNEVLALCDKGSNAVVLTKIKHPPVPEPEYTNVPGEAVKDTIICGKGGDWHE